jgi:hypothetical protein
VSSFPSSALVITLRSVLSRLVLSASALDIVLLLPVLSRLDSFPSSTAVCMTDAGERIGSLRLPSVSLSSVRFPSTAAVRMCDTGEGICDFTLHSAVQSLCCQPMLSFALRRLVKGVVSLFRPLHCPQLCFVVGATPESRPRPDTMAMATVTHTSAHLHHHGNINLCKSIGVMKD